MKKFLTCILLSLLSLPAFGKRHEHRKDMKERASHHHKSHTKHRRQHKAHEHGIANLDMTFDQNRSIIDLILTVPMDDLVGFEHSARTPEERKQIDLKKEDLSRSSIATFSAKAKCQQKSLEVSFPESLHKKHEHKKHEHSDVRLISSFFCETPKAISSMSFDIFAKMPKTKKIKFRYTGFHDSTKKTGEGVGYLTPKSPKITL
tara:strand:+ start:1797 stop:2408 length:612 start_codon:yes stop_codon:yes gene_type:complete